MRDGGEDVWDGLADWDATALRLEIDAVRREPSLDPRLQPLLDHAGRALSGTRGQARLGEALAAFDPILDVLSEWPRPRCEEEDPPCSIASPLSPSDRRMVQCAVAFGAIWALLHGPGDERGRRLARTAVLLRGARERAGAARDGDPLLGRRPPVDYPALLGRVRRHQDPVGAGPVAAVDLLESVAPVRPECAAVLQRPSARRIIDLVGASPGGLTVPEISDALGRHHTTLRPQLAALELAGVITARPDPRAGPGRPPVRYRLATAPATRQAAGHRALVRMLMLHARSMDLTAGEIERAGAGQGAALVEPDGGLPEIVRALARLGFRPRHCPGLHTEDLILGRCPFAAAGGGPAHESVCRMHRGMVQGMIRVTAPGLELRDFGVRVDGDASCLMRFTAPGGSGEAEAHRG